MAVRLFSILHAGEKIKTSQDTKLAVHLKTGHVWGI